MIHPSLTARQTPPIIQRPTELAPWQRQSTKQLNPRISNKDCPLSNLAESRHAVTRDRSMVAHSTLSLVPCAAVCARFSGLLPSFKIRPEAPLDRISIMRDDPARRYEWSSDACNHWAPMVTLQLVLCCRWKLGWHCLARVALALPAVCQFPRRHLHHHTDVTGL